MPAITTIHYSSHFKGAMRKLPSSLAKEVEEREVLFRDNYVHPQLKTHKLSGRLKECWSFSLTRSHRVLFRFTGKSSVEFLDVGDHSIYR